VQAPTAATQRGYDKVSLFHPGEVADQITDRAASAAASNQRGPDERARRSSAPPMDACIDEPAVAAVIRES
jgi:hypothetical protein